MERWQRQLIKLLFPYSAKRMRIESAFMIKEPHIPKLLYKYRSFSSNHKSALEKNVLFMSSPDHLTIRMRRKSILTRIDSSSKTGRQPRTRPR
jgi:hypothetical protein